MLTRQCLMIADATVSESKTAVRRGRLVVLAGPSAVGKSSVVRELRTRLPELVFSVSATTRDPRPGEVDGKDYRFTSREEFQRMIDSGELLEWAEIHGGLQRSGTPAAPVEEALEAGKPVLVEVDLAADGGEAEDAGAGLVAQVPVHQQRGQKLRIGDGIGGQVGLAGLQRALALVQDGERIVGAIFRIDNAPVFVRAKKGVVLATGGFVMNEEMRRKHCPQTFKIKDPIGDKDDGSGINMGVGAGGEAIHMDQFFTTCPWTIPESHAKGVFVNIQGQRFINEDCYHGRVSRTAVDQPGNRVYLLLDSAHFEQPPEFGRMTIAGTGNDWEEVERELEMAEGTLSRTMDFYNRHAREGRDPLFDKQPPILTPLDQGPFVALELNFETSYFSFFTLGGLKTSPHAEVLNRGGKPIPGLFAAGRCTSGLPAWGHGYSSGMSLADCTFFGRQAGRTAAQG